MFSSNDKNNNTDCFKQTQALAEAYNIYLKKGRINDYAREKMTDGEWTITSCSERSERGLAILRRTLSMISEALQKSDENATTACKFFEEIFKNDKIHESAGLRENFENIGVSATECNRLKKGEILMENIIKQLYCARTEMTGSFSKRWFAY